MNPDIVRSIGEFSGGREIPTLWSRSSGLLRQQVLNMLGEKYGDQDLYGLIIDAFHADDVDAIRQVLSVQWGPIYPIDWEIFTPDIQSEEMGRLIASYVPGLTDLIGQRFLINDREIDRIARYLRNRNIFPNEVLSYSPASMRIALTLMNQEQRDTLQSDLQYDIAGIADSLTIPQWFILDDFNIIPNPERRQYIRDNRLLNMGGSYKLSTPDKALILKYDSDANWRSHMHQFTPYDYKYAHGRIARAIANDAELRDQFIHEYQMILNILERHRYRILPRRALYEMMRATPDARDRELMYSLFVNSI